MNDQSRHRAEELFQQAADLPPERRPSFLDEHCGGDASLRAEVDSLLACLEDTRIESLKDVELVEDPEADYVGQEIGPYKLLELIGEGGFGSVYMAEQREPIQRRVAVKVVKLGMDTKQVIARFEAERQALAMMDHPNIAKVLDAGATSTGRPYFVMELVRGIPITQYCDENDLSMRQRLELFVKVCHAVQHAHQKGIIHRDLKPTNVLVTLHDGTPVPKVIDFGIAKATNKRLTEKTLFTEFHQFIGTPEYMSPEQAEMSGLDIDTRTDIYSLGVLLYVLLTGKTPFDAKTLRQVAYWEIQRIIREQDPPTPSVRVSRLGKELDGVAKSRRIAPQNLSKIMRGDLDWIVMKTLEKDRRRRYDSAAALAADIMRHLDNEPVMAGPPGAAYKVRKFIRRHRVAVMTSAIVAAGLLVGFSLATLGFIEATMAKAELKNQIEAAERARQGEHRQRQRAESNAERALMEATKYSAANVFLQDMLALADPANAQQGREVTIHYVLDEASKQIRDGSLSRQPEVEASVRLTVGKSYLALGLYKDAVMHLKAAEEIRTRVLGAEEAETLCARSLLAHALVEYGLYKEAEVLLRPTLKAMQRVLGEEHPETLRTRDRLGISLWRQDCFTEAEAIHRNNLEIQRRVLGEEHEETLRSMVNIGTVLWGQKRIHEAEAVLSEALERQLLVLGDEHPETMRAMNNLGLVLDAQKKYAEAEEYFRYALEIDKRVLGPDHPRTRIPLNNLIKNLRTQGKEEEIKPFTIEQIAQQRRAAEHPDASDVVLNDFAWLLLTCDFEDLRDPETALIFAEKAIEKGGGKNANILDTLSLAYEMTGDLDRAIEIEREALTIALSEGGYNWAMMEERLITMMLKKGDLFGLSQIGALKMIRNLKGGKEEKVKWVPPMDDMQPPPKP